jgi:hypothetical protein
MHKLHLFNSSLLAKQCWRLLNVPHSLFHRVLKARYFPSCNLQEASLGSNPSFLWRSLLSGRDVIKKGLRWSNHNGSLIRPLWIETKSGLFTVKSAYEMLERDRRQSVTGECSGTVDLRWMWQKNWKLNIPGKVKHFLWRAYHDSLPTNHQLHRRRIRASPVCGVCAQETKTTIHALWECPLAHNVWALLKGRMQKLPNQGGDFSVFMRWIFQECSRKEIADWALLAWAIWNARNRFVF